MNNPTWWQGVDSVKQVARAIYQAWVDAPHGQGRTWHAQIANMHQLHPSVVQMLRHYTPSYQTLTLEWPHVSETDPQRLAYTPSEAYGLADRQVVTSIGKYLARHWKHLPDHTRRDIQALYTPDAMSFIYTIPEFVYAVNTGPRSCMASACGVIPFHADDHAQMLAWRADPDAEEPDWEKHPYASYDPEFGWHMAVRTSGGQVDGRALCLNYDGGKFFVRTYLRMATPELRSEADHALEAWLKEQGYQRERSWPEGAKLLMPDIYGGEYRAPYLDGDRQRVRNVRGDVFVIDEDGDFVCDNTNGTADRRDEDSEEFETSCDECGDGCDETTATGRDREHYVCDHCRGDHFSFVRGAPIRFSNDSGYSEYYAEDDNAEPVINCSYQVDDEHLPDDVVQLNDGRYAELDDVVCIDDEYYLSSDYRVVELHEEHPDTGDMYALRDDAWREHGTAHWYSNATEWEEADGKKYHPDTLAELRDEQQVAPTLWHVVDARGNFQSFASNI